MSTFACFPSDYIPLRGACDALSEESSGLYINDLPGLSFKLLASIADEEQKNAITAYNVSHENGLKRFNRDFKLALAELYQYKNIVSSNVFGALAATYTASLGTKTYGKKIEKIDCRDRYQCLFIEYVEISVSQDVSIDLNIIDGCNTTSTTHALTCGKNRILLNYEVLSDEVIISYDSTVDFTPDELYCEGLGSCGCNACSSYGISGYPGYKTTNVELSGASYIDSADENGLKIAASIRCSAQEIVCLFQEEAAEAIRYAIGIDILNQARFSDRINALIRTKKDDAAELLILWDGGDSAITGFKHKGEYHKTLAGVVMAARTFLKNETANSRCLDCRGRNFQEITP